MGDLEHWRHGSASTGRTRTLLVTTATARGGDDRDPPEGMRDPDTGDAVAT